MADPDVDDRSTSMVIVALPEEDDYVYKISSEDVPHMTLLFLGDQANNPNLEHIFNFITHVADTMLYRFGLMVDHRGELGPDNADVLFFDQQTHDIRAITAARNALLADPKIKEAFDANDQFPEWAPHLTLGYPTNPAHEGDRDFPINYVNFDRLALWTGDSEGPEFLLKRRKYGDLAMSDISQTLGGVTLTHHGVKGQKWGVRQDRGHEGETAKTKTIARADKKYNKSLSGLNGFIKVNNAVASRINPKLEVLNNKPEYKGKDLNKNPALQKKYFKEYQKNLEDSLTEAMADIGSNASGTQRIHLIRVGEGETTSYEGYTEAINHADNPANIKITLKFDTLGHITSQEIKPIDGIEHGNILAGIELTHHGVKGQKWGVTRDRVTGKVSGTATAAKAGIKKDIAERKSNDVTVRAKPGSYVKTVGGHGRDAHEDAVSARTSNQIAKKSSTDALSNKELQGLVTRMNLEQQYKNLSSQEDRRSAGEVQVNKFLKENGDAVASKHPVSKAALSAARFILGNRAPKQGKKSK